MTFIGGEGAHFHPNIPRTPSSLNKPAAISPLAADATDWIPQNHARRVTSFVRFVKSTKVDQSSGDNSPLGLCLHCLSPLVTGVTRTNSQ